MNKLIIFNEIDRFEARNLKKFAAKNEKKERKKRNRITGTEKTTMLNLQKLLIEEKRRISELGFESRSDTILIFRLYENGSG